MNSRLLPFLEATLAGLATDMASYGLSFVSGTPAGGEVAGYNKLLADSRNQASTATRSPKRQMQLL